MYSFLRVNFIKESKEREMKEQEKKG